MAPIRERVLLVAVGPEGLAPGTVAFAVDHADRLGLDIELVHVVPTVVGAPTGMWDAGMTLAEMTRIGRQSLDAAVAAVRDRAAPGCGVTGDLVCDGVVATLVDRSRDAEVVVLQHRRGTPWERRSLGSVAGSVAARAHAPVVSVPASWNPADAAGCPVTVAVKGHSGTEAATAAAVWAGVGLAAVTDRPLEVLRVVPVGDVRQVSTMLGGDRAGILARVRADLEEQAGLGRDVESRVPVSFEVRCGRPADVLVDVSAASALLVVARHSPHLPFGSHLGPVARHLVQLSACPVLVVDPVGPYSVPAEDERRRDAVPLPV